ncbi:hypothetical protein niasHT_036363 [Heterodera trifolii]|uniref:Uncharacterized protein n=1 Tax=Heterodera trifolii TaxID=157864 RepID=A0ABD2J1G3_9BILA
MEQSLKNDCQLPSQEPIENYATIVELLEKIEQRHPAEKYKWIKSSILAKSAVASMQEKLNTILNTANNANEAWQALYKLKSDLHYHPCWLRTMADGNEWKREPLFHFVQIVRLDLMKASLIAFHCAYISSADNELDIDQKFNEIAFSMQKTAAHVADWVEKMLENSWPTISRINAKSAIGDLDIKEIKKEYQTVANNISYALGQTGELEYDYTVIVFPNWTDPEAMAIISEANSYFDLIDIKQINVIVVRIEDNKTNYELACKAAAWFTPQIKAKMKYIINIWRDNKKPLNELAKELKQSLQYYRNLVLIHNWKFFSFAATITLGIDQASVSRRASAEQSFDHKIVPALFDAEIFHVHMLL